MAARLTATWRPARWARPARPAASLYSVALALAVLWWPLAPIGAAMPTLTLDPASGPCGSRVAVRGEGFAPGETIDLVAQRTAPTRVPGAQYAIATVAADGTFAAEARVFCADDPDGAQYTIYAVRRPADPSGSGTVAASAVFTVSSAPRCFAQTGYCVQGRFLTYWTTWGGLPINGYPLSEEFVQTLEDGRQYTVQYFERVRMEHHPENAPPYDVLLGQFGRRLHAADPPAAPRADAIYLGETGHNIGGRFRDYWLANGALRQFGYPLTEEFDERLEDGRVYTVQYFERARFEWHPENAPPYDVLLGQFGRRILAETTR